MWRAWLSWLRKPVRAQPPAPPPTTPRLLKAPPLRPAPPLPRRLQAASFNPKAAPPAAVLEFDRIRDHEFKIWDGTGLDGVIAAYRTSTVDANRLALLAAYLRLLRDLAEPTPLRHIDFHLLPEGARPHLLGPYLGTIVGRAFPRLCWETSDPAKGKLTYVFSGGPADVTTWRQRLPEICAWLGGFWTIANTTANTISLVPALLSPTPYPSTARFSGDACCSSASTQRPTGHWNCHLPT